MAADLTTDKAALRARALAARAAGGDGAALQANLHDALTPHGGAMLAGYWPMRGEPDPRPALAAHDGPVCLPVVPGPAMPLLFRLWRGEPLVCGPWGTSHPSDSAPLVEPAVVIVPLVGFDLRLHRLGYGGGFYDRTLEKLRKHAPVTAIGLAWAAQALPEIPDEPTDQPLDMIVTDKTILRASDSGGAVDRSVDNA
ncbi:MAG TPA: 5-formyltetrahydrofolate cyclo-ligase [Paracoccus sp. (in: a-proteobacteria)]|nr:5-formyltetrahydrofolate cyclo-ligase [Paracoccus sp. (in: a-proteobacteria)]